MVHEQKKQFKDIPSSTCLDSSERRVLDMNGLGPRFNSHWGNILLLDFCFHAAKVLMSILPLLSILSVLNSNCETKFYMVICTLHSPSKQDRV